MLFGLYSIHHESHAKPVLLCVNNQLHNRYVSSVRIGDVEGIRVIDVFLVNWKEFKFLFKLAEEEWVSDASSFMENSSIC